MSETTPTKPIPRRRRRWLRFSLGTLFLGLTALCVALAVWVHRAETQRQAVAVIQQAGGAVDYDAEYGPTGLRDLIGRDFFERVNGVFLGGDAATDASVMAARRIASLQNLHIYDGERMVQDGQLELTEIRPVKLSRAGFRALARQNRIESLLLGTNLLTDDDLQWVGTMHGLRWLGVRSENLSDKSFSHLKQLGQLTTLLLDGNHGITDACVPDLAKLAQLRDLNLSNTGVTDAGVQQLQTALPNCRIIHSKMPTNGL